MRDALDGKTAYVLAADEGTPMSWFGQRLTLKASNADIGVVEVVIEPGAEPPMHVHAREEEWFYVVEGEATFWVGGDEHKAPAGTFVGLPRNVPHTFAVDSARARFLMINTPGGFERMFERAPNSEADVAAAFDAFDVGFAGPNPRYA